MEKREKTENGQDKGRIQKFGMGGTLALKASTSGVGNGEGISSPSRLGVWGSVVSSPWAEIELCKI